MRLPAIVLGSLLAVVPAAPSTAGTTDGSGAEVVDGSPVAVVVVGREGAVASWSASDRRRGVRLTCSYFDWGVDAPVPVKFADEPTTPRGGGLYLFTCVTAGGDLTVARLVVFDPGDPFAGVAAAERALDEARRRLDLPTPRPGLNPPGDQLVGLRTWLWLDEPWRPSSATAAVGAVTSTVTATPVRATWSMGDGTSVVCGPGAAYDRDRDPAVQTSDCTHVYSKASTGLLDGTYAVTVTVDYDIGWVATTGAGGSLETLTTQITVPVVVRHAQAVIR